MDNLTAVWRFQDPEVADSEYVKTKFTNIKVLMDKGAALATITHPSTNATPLGLALMTFRENLDVIQLFLDRGALVTEDEVEIIKQFIARNTDMATLSALLLGLAEISIQLSEKPKADCELSADPEDEISWSLLRDELLQTAEHVIYKVAERIATELQRSGYGETESILACGLCEALQNCHEEITRCLLEIGASPNWRDELGNTPALMVLQPHLKLGADCITDQIKVLLDFGAEQIWRTYTIFRLACSIIGMENEYWETGRYLYQTE
ncbi:hypothetical protein IFR05_001282 [Cadophora sp. M221]|nr:hypothetical protein IFR05_001282 [Cadophora sp. M221]